MSTLVWLLGFTLVQVPMFLFYKKTVSNTRRRIDSRFMTDISSDVRQEEMGETLGVVTLSDFRKKFLTGFMMCFVAAGFLGSWGVGWGPQPDKAEWQAQWPLMTLLIVLGYFAGGVLPWLGAVFYAGEFRVVTKNGILKVSALFGTYFVRWNQILLVDSRTSRDTWWFIVRTDKGTFNVWSECVNLGVFVEGVVGNLSMDKWKPLIDKRKVNVRMEEAKSGDPPGG